MSDIQVVFILIKSAAALFITLFFDFIYGNISVLLESTSKAAEFLSQSQEVIKWITSLLILVLTVIKIYQSIKNKKNDKEHY